MPIRVLIADPDESLLDSYGGYLSRNGFEVVTATNGLECIERLKHFDPDVVVLELEMPWGGGDGVLAVLHEQFDIPPVPVLVLTAKQDACGFHAAMACRMVTNYHTKPLGSEQLARLIRRVFADGPSFIENTHPLSASARSRGRWS